MPDVPDVPDEEELPMVRPMPDELADKLARARAAWLARLPAHQEHLDVEG